MMSCVAPSDKNLNEAPNPDALLWQTGEPPAQGWYDCEVGGEEVTLQWWICKMNPRKRYWKTKDGRSVTGEVKWIGEPSASVW